MRISVPPSKLRRSTDPVVGESQERARLFSGPNLTNIAGYSILSGLGLVWLIELVVIPLSLTPFTFTPQFYTSLFFDLLIIVVVVPFLVHSWLDLATWLSPRGGKSPESSSRQSIERLTLNQRIQHLLLIVTFTVNAITGFAQMYYEAWGRVWASLIGGLPANMNLHMASAIAMGMLVTYHFAYYGVQYVVRRIVGIKAPLDIMPSRSDLRNFIHMIRFYLLLEKEPPQFGRFNYVQKFDYWGVYWGIAMLGVPGVIIALWGYSWAGGLAYIFHTKEALVAVLFLLVAHSYNAHLNPRTFPLDKVAIFGTISEERMRLEHPLEIESSTVRKETFKK